MTSPNIQETVLKYENYINDVLKKDLKGIEGLLLEINTDISDFIQQRHTLKVVSNKNSHPDGFKTQVNIGCNFFLEAKVPDTSTMLVNIGLGYYLELSTEEADKYLESMIKRYEGNAERLRVKAAETNAHIKMLLLGIQDLINESNKG